MKQEANKKSKKLIWLVVGLVALLLVVGAVLAILLIPGQQSADPTGPVGGRPELYWNVDRNLYLGNEESAGLSIREPAEDGLYHIRFAYNGELVEYTFADKRLVNVIDNMDVLGLVFDADGNPIDVVDPETFATEVVESFFVMRSTDSVLTVNSSILMNGMEVPIDLCDLTEVYDVRMDAEDLGAIAEVEMMDKVVVYANDKGETTHVYITERQPAADVYWRVGRYYNSTTKETSRVPDENGVYTMTFAKDGKQVELKCKDKALVTTIDQKGGVYNAPKGLVVDADGFIQQQVEPIIALRGKCAGSEYHITEMNGNTITATYLLTGNENGKTFTVEVPEDCPIYNVCVGGSADMIGEPTELQMYDRIICYTDLEGKPILIYVMYRMANSPMYWNITRMYDSTTMETARVPDANGYYKFKLAVEGKQVTLRTKDKAIATQIDSLTYFMFGLDVEGDIIKRVYQPAYVSGNDTYGAGGIRFLTDQTGSIMSFVTTFYEGFSPFNLVAKPDVEVYDVTGYPGTTVGEKTTVNVGDTLRFMADWNNNVTHIYVTERYTGEPIYYNYARLYSDSKAETTRTPNEEGYYVFEMASRGKEYTGANALKTKDKAIANIIDAQLAPVVALDVKDGIIRAAYPAATSHRFGYKTSNYHWIQSVNDDGTYTTIVKSTGKTYTYKLAEDCKVYNVSQYYSDHRGEKISVSSLRPGDRIQAIATKNDSLVREIYVMSRTVASKFYYNINRKYSSVTLSTTRVPDAEGYYVFDLAVEGEIKQYKTKDVAIATAIDYFNYVPFGMTLDGDIIKSAFPATYIKGVGSVPASNYDVTKISGRDVTVTRYLPSTTNVGATIDLKLASNYKAYNVSAYAEPFGGKVKLGLGDRAIYYANEDGEVEWIYIWYKNTHEKGHISYCEHCDKKVYWQPYAGTTYSSYGADNVHLYVTNSTRKFAQAIHGKLDMPESDRTEVILDLNGQTLQTSSYRNFLVYGTLSIVDTVGGGKLLGSTDAGTANGGSIMIGKGGVVNLYSGTLTENPKNVTNANGGVVYLGEGGTLNMYGGTIEGGTANSAGGNVWIGNATFNMTGGTIAGDVAVVSKDAKISIGGDAKITAGAAGGLILPQGALLSLDEVTEDTEVVVDAQGVFTEEASNIEDYLDNFSASAPEFQVVVKGDALSGGRLAYCQHCDKEVYWTKFSAKNASGHYIVTEDMEMNSQMTIGYCSNHGKENASCNHAPDVAVDLNGHTITTDGTGVSASTGRFALVYGKLSIMDSSAAQTGKIIATRNATIHGGVIMANVISTVNLYGGELTMAEDAMAARGGIIYQSYSSFNMYGGKLTGGKVASSVKADGTVDGGLGGNLFVGTGSYANIYGGVIENGEAEVGGNLYVMTSAKIHGGQIKDGVANTRVTENFDGTTGKTTYTYANGLSGNIHITSSGRVTIGVAEGETATVSGGTSRCGGSIYNSGTLVIEKTGIVTGGQAVAPTDVYTNYSGGNIFNDKSLTVKGVVSDGKAWNGGNISDNSAATTVIDGGTVTGGEATNGAGGNYYTVKADLQLINGAAVSDGKATLYRGGNIYLGNGAALSVTDSTISGGYAGENGGNIYQYGREVKDDPNFPTGYEYAVMNVENSTITGGEAAVSGGNIYAGRANITVTGSTVSDGVSKTPSGYTGGGNIYVANAGLAITGSTVSNGQTTRYGGNILASNVDLTLGTGTVVSGGKCSWAGGSICKWNTGDLTIEAGVTVGRGDAGQGSGGTIYMDNSVTTAAANLYIAGTVEGVTRVSLVGGEVNTTVSGDAKLDGLYLPKGYKINVGELTENADLKVSASGVFTVANEQASTFKDRFSAVDPTLGILVNDSNELEMGIVNYCQHCQKEVIWNAFSGTAASTGHYIVTKNMEMNSQLVIGSCSNHGKADANCNHTPDVVVDLNGYTVTTDGTGVGASTGRFALVYGKLSIMDSSAAQSGKIVTKRNATHMGGVILAHVSANVNLYGGELTMAETAGAGKGGIIYQIYGSFNMYGGKLSGGTVDGGLGGNLYVDTSATANIYGGIIEGGTAKLGGNIYAAGKLNITGGEITGGKAIMVTNTDNSTTPATVTYTEGDGGNLYTMAQTNIGKEDGTATVTISGGTGRSGGNIYCKSGTLNIYKGVTVSGGVASEDSGGNIYMYEHTKLTVQGTVTGGKALKKRGGNIATIGGATVDVIGAEITDGEAVDGGNLNTNNGNINISQNAKITGGKATGYGGNIYAWSVSAGRGIAITDSTVSGGEAAMGGNIYSTGSTGSYNTVTITNSTVTEGNSTTTATYGGGGNIYGIYATITVTGSRVDKGVTTKCGGNILVTHANLILENGTVVDGGTGTVLGGNICKFNSGDLEVRAGATVSGGSVGSGSGGTIWVNNAASGTTCNVRLAGTVTGVFRISSGTVITTVSGDVNLSNLLLSSGMKLTLGELTENASITVSASGVFTNESDKAAEYKKYFLPAARITVVGNTLSMS